MKKILLLLFGLIQFGGQYRQSNLSSSSDTSGYTAGSFSVTDAGAATYTVPIILIPGTAGLQPGLSISYSSQGGNGLLGLGTSLQGFSVISRASQTIAQDGLIKGLSFSSTDKFALDGERLVLVNSADQYGGNGVEYRTEQNAFYKIISYGIGNTPTSFKVLTNSGLIMEYGTTDSSRAKIGGNTPVFWLIDKITDTKGNYYTFKYHRDNQTAEYYPLEIAYTGNLNASLTPYASVKFDYETRNDTSSQYSNDYKIVSNSKRLKSIKNYYGDSIIRSYNFNYQYNSANFSQLVSIQECGRNGECNQPTKFIYSNNSSPQFSTSDINSIQQGINVDIFPADLNADGVQDILKVTKGAILEGYISNENPQNLDFNSIGFSPSISVASKLSLADFNGDGRIDFLTYDSITGANTLYLNITDASDNQIKTKKINGAIPSSVLANDASVSFNDFNGDGRSDIVSYDPSTGVNKWMFSSAIGNSIISFFKSFSDSIFLNLINPSFVKYPQQLSFLDVNGDGLTDVFTLNLSTGENWIYYNGGGTPISFPNKNANVFSPSILLKNGGRLSTQDMNGDGLPDFMFYLQNTGENYWWLNEGGIVFKSIAAKPSNLKSLITGGSNLLQTDFNSDGYTDLLWIDKATGQNKWFANDGRFNFTQLTGNLISINDLKGYEFHGLGNFTSKSYLDFFVFNKSASPKAKFIKSNNQSNNLLSSIVSGNGLAIEINYDLLTSDSLYKKHDDAVFPLMDYQATQYVVKNYKSDNGIGGKSQVSYQYYGAKIHLEGRGFRGFSQIDIIDETSRITESRYYLSDKESWKYISSPLVRTTTKLPNGVIISDTKMENGLDTFYHGKCHFSFVKKNTSKTYEIDGTFVDSTVTTQEYDDYGNVVGTVTDYGEGYKDSLVNFFLNDQVKWILGRLQKSTLYRIAPNKPTIIKNSAFEYDMTGGTGLLVKEIVEPDSGNTVKITKTYKHDVFGNIIQSSVSAWNGAVVETRTTSSVMDAKGRFTIQFTNAAGHVSNSTYDPYMGHVLTGTDANNLVTKNYYDGMGRIVKTIAPDGNWVTTEYLKCNSTYNCPSLAVHIIVVKSSTGPPVIKYYDLLNREIRTEHTGFDGQKIYTDVIYNERGLVEKQSKPYFSTDVPIFTQIRYDVIGRPTVTISPGNIIDSVRHAGRTTIAINAIGQKKTVIKNAKEQLVKVLDNQNNPITYDYDAAGRLTKITDPMGNTILTKYDIHGNKIQQTDPDLGTYKYSINGFGELVSQTDSKNNTVTFEYDSLGRWTKRIEPEGITTRTFDTKPNGIGQIAKVESYNGFYAAPAYDNYGRVISDTQRIDGELYSYQTTYDTLGRVESLTYPTGFSVSNEYNAYGYLSQIKDGTTGKVYWSASVIGAAGEIEEQYYGNGTKIKNRYDPITDFLTQIITTNDTATLQNELYAYNNLGNLLQRWDARTNNQEDFWYDDLNRLVKSKVFGKDSILLSYDMLGNITSKSDVGTYTYGGVNAGPHQVQSIQLSTTQCIPSSEVDFNFHSFDKVKELKKGNLRVEIDYNPDRQRNVHKMYENNQLTRTKIYVSGLLEKEIKGNDTITTHYISGPEAVIATYTTYSVKKDSNATRYFHRDHLGTAVLVTNDTGGVAGRFSFDAWGKRRNADWATELTDKNTLLADRGFTGHEHYDLFDLVDMNGRIYDPIIGRFISADPFIQDVTNLQSLNRYSYVLNNPLSFTDPSGYFFKKLFKSIGKAIKSVVRAVKENWREIVVAAVSITVGIYAAPLGAFLSGAASGFASSVTSTLLSGGNFGDAIKAGIRGAVISGVTARLTEGIGDKWGHETTTKNVLKKSIAHGVVQGGANVAQGGKFIHGFISGSIVSAASPAIGGIKDGANAYTYRVAASAVLGGTVSELTGGSFANGAITGAFVRMYNCEFKDLTEQFDKTVEKTSGKYYNKSLLFRSLPFSATNLITSRLLMYMDIFLNFQDGGDFDLKSHGYSLNNIDGVTCYNGKQVKYDYYGNYNFGVAIKAYGISLTEGLMGSGAYQVYKKNGNPDWTNYRGFFDHKQDTEAIIQGYNR